MSAKRWGALVVLFAGGGSIYILPYLSAYFYIPMKQSMHLSNTQLGLMTSAMGFTSMLFYWPGGWMADRFSPRKLIAFSFAANGFLGLWLASFPSFPILMTIELVMGVFLTLTYWSALIKATRQLSSGEEEGRFFGILEGGRNLTAVAVIGVGFWIFAHLHSGTDALRESIILFSVVLFLIAILSWIFLEDRAEPSRDEPAQQQPLRAAILQVVRIPAVWLIMFIILCAYVTSIGITYITPFATDVYKQSVVFGGLLYTMMQWSSVPASPAAGWAADRFSTSVTTFWLLIAMAVSLFLFALVHGGAGGFWFLVINSLAIGVLIYGLRGIYFALLQEARIPISITGGATGLISFIAYTPDVFIPFYAGRLLDRFPANGLGYRYFFLTLGVFSLIGAALTLLFRARISRGVSRSQVL